MTHSDNYAYCECDAPSASYYAVGTDSNRGLSQPITAEL